MMTESPVPPYVLDAFQGEPHLTMPRLAKVLRMDRNMPIRLTPTATHASILPSK